MSATEQIDPELVAEQVDRFLKADAGKEFIKALQGKLQEYSKTSEDHTKPSEQRLFALERSAATRESLNWLTDRQANYGSGYYKRKT